MPISILIADDHEILRSGLRSLLSENKQFDIIAEASDGREALTKAEELKPDVIVMDISMPGMNGMEATRQILEKEGEIKIIALSVHSDKQFIAGMLQAGASGYLLKDCAVDELEEAITTVIHGDTYLSSRITGTVVQHFRDILNSQHTSAFDVLTEREREVLQLIAEGGNTKEIAAKLYVSVKTIETHRQNLMNKLKIYNIPDLVKYAIREGLVSL
ncbi:MAG: response regulator transcription factor [candidate division KSB1 bacterium]|nr:response regulator transcription factor [candidate division KSB1 bacterium]